MPPGRTTVQAGMARGLLYKSPYSQAWRPEPGIEAAQDRREGEAWLLGGQGMTVEKLMTKEVRSCGPHDTLAAAAHQMWDGDCGALPVVEGAERRVVGVITDRDICMAGYFKGTPLDQIQVESVMSRIVKSCHPADDLAAAEATMASARVRRLPVVDASGQLLGMLSLADIAREAGRKVGGRRSACSPAEVAETVAAIIQPHRELVATQS